MPWLDGTLHEGPLVPFDASDRGLLLGDGIFDTSLVLGGTMVWREAHVARLVAAGRTLGFAIDPGRINTAIDAVLAQTKHASLRITVTRGGGPRGLAPPKEPKPIVLAAIAPLRTVALFAPLNLHATDIRRNDTSPVSRVKSLNYLDAILASRDALAAGADDALFRNTKDHIACTSVGNVMALIGDQLVTPPIGDGLIPGTSRAVVLGTCDELGLEPVERSMTMTDLDKADAILVTNSLRLVAPVNSIGRKSFGSSASRRVQAIIAHVAALIRAETGVDPRVLAEG